MLLSDLKQAKQGQRVAVKVSNDATQAMVVHKELLVMHSLAINHKSKNQFRYMSRLLGYNVTQVCLGFRV